MKMMDRSRRQVERAKGSALCDATVHARYGLVAKRRSRMGLRITDTNRGVEYPVEL